MISTADRIWFGW